MTMKLTHSRLFRDSVPFPAEAIRKVNTIAEAKLLTSDPGLTDGENVQIPGFGLYRYDVSSNRTANDFDVLLPSTGVGRLILIGSGGDGGGIINLASWAEVAAETPAPDMARGALGKDLAGDGGYSVWIWLDGDTTPDDGKWFMESTVVGYRPGEAKEGRWARVIASQGLIDQTSDFALAHPGIWDLLFFNDADVPAWFRWVSGDTTLPNATTVFASSVAGFGIGDAGEGRWKMIGPFAPIRSKNTPSGHEGPPLYLYAVTVDGATAIQAQLFNGLPTGYSSAASRSAAGTYSLTIKAPLASEVTDSLVVLSIIPERTAPAYANVWSTSTSVVGPNREHKIQYRAYDQNGTLVDTTVTFFLLMT